jgi:lysophospholipase L1-like esterase
MHCVDHNPGSTIETDFLNAVQTLEQNYETLVTWIKKRAQANNVPEPKVVFTNYPNPLPPDGTKCPDTNYL